MEFTYNSRIIRHLGTDLITSDEIAITELIKNSYDAKAKNVRIQLLTSLEIFKKSSLINTEILEDFLQILKDSDTGHGVMLFEDNGYGMDLETLEKGFFTIGSDLKSKKRLDHKPNKAQDILLGDKGIGRLSAQRLSPIMFIETSTEGSNEVIFIEIKWADFIKEKDAKTIEDISERFLTTAYTRLWLFGTKSQPIKFDRYYKEDDVPKFYDLFGNASKERVTRKIINQDLQTALSYLLTPFSSTKNLLNIEILSDGDRVNIDFNSDYLSLAESIHSFKISKDTENEGHPLIDLSMVLKPWYIERVHSSFYKDAKSFAENKRTPKFYNLLLEKYSKRFNDTLRETLTTLDINEKYEINLAQIEELTPVYGEIHSFKRDNKFLKMFVDSALENNFIKDNKNPVQLRDFLNANNGVKLYRNGFRVGTLGNKDNDWLKLQQSRTTGQQFSRFDLGNCIGYVQINDPLQQYIFETSSRENLLENPCTNELLLLLNKIFNSIFYNFTKSAVTITKSILEEENLIPENKLDDLAHKLDKNEEIHKNAENNIKEFNRISKILLKNKELDTPEKVKAVKQTIEGLQEVTENISTNLADSRNNIQDAKQVIEVAAISEKRIEEEAYNNYKLMANGLITETITHELHGIISNSKVTLTNSSPHFLAISDFIKAQENFPLITQHLNPIKRSYEGMYKNIGNLNVFYKFIEKTFIYRGKIEDFEKLNLKTEFFDDFSQAFAKELSKNKIELIYKNSSIDIFVPAGSLIHLFHNLVTNSIYWIKERRRRARLENHFYSSEPDQIIIEKSSDKSIRVTDTGTGIFPNMVHSLFLQQESGKEHGRGMGLYIVKQFLNSFDSTIELLPKLNEYNNPYIFEITFNN